MATPVQMPKQGNTVEECIITEWRIKEGDTVKAGDIICGIETDKATFEVEAPEGGTVLKLLYNDGDLVPVLTDIAILGNPGEDISALASSSATPSSEAPASTPAATPAPAAAEVSTPAAASPVTSAATGSGDLLSPRARMETSRLGVDPSGLAGTGAKGRVTSRDVLAAAESGRLTPLAKAVAAETGLAAGAGTGLGGRVRAGDLGAAPAAGAAAPAVAAAAACVNRAEPKVVPYKSIRKLIGDRMMQSLTNHAQLTMNASADATSIMGYRKRLKDQAEKLGLPNITLNDMVAFVVSRTLPKFPELNAIFDMAGAKIEQHSDVQLAMAIDTERGLMVPVIRNADLKTLSDIANEIRDMAGQCKSGSIDPDLLSGGTFTITNLGAMGVESFTPVINSPQVAILGVCGIEQKPFPGPDGSVKFKPMMGLSLTIDHQVVDGAPAARFLQALANGIANFELILAS